MGKKMTDIFEITNDLPNEVKSNLVSLEKNRIDNLLIDLLTIAKRPLTLNELIVGLYRKYNVQIDRAKITAKLYRMVANKQLIKPTKSLYALE